MLIDFFRFERERAKLTDTIKLLEQGLSETQAEVVTLKTSNEEMKNKITDVCGEENLSDIKKTLAGKFIDQNKTCLVLNRISVVWICYPGYPFIL